LTAGTIRRVTDDGKTLTEQLEELGAQLDWVREYL
jgi:valyl-tRNA synthetase